MWSTEIGCPPTVSPPIVLPMLNVCHIFLGSNFGSNQLDFGFQFRPRFLVQVRVRPNCSHNMRDVTAFVSPLSNCPPLPSLKTAPLSPALKLPPALKKLHLLVTVSLSHCHLAKIFSPLEFHFFKVGPNTIKIKLSLAKQTDMYACETFVAEWN